MKLNDLITELRQCEHSSFLERLSHMRLLERQENTTETVLATKVPLAHSCHPGDFQLSTTGALQSPLAEKEVNVLPNFETLYKINIGKKRTLLQRGIDLF